MAKDAAGNLSAVSNTVNVTTLATDIPITFSLSVSGITTSSADLSWIKATDKLTVIGYNIYQNGELKTTTTNTSLSVSGLSASTTYSFYVTSIDNTGNLYASSNIINATTPSSEATNLAVNTIDDSSLMGKKSGLKLYPNPVKGDLLNISNLENPSYCRIFNLLGQELERNHIENNAVYVGSLKAGVYLIEVTDGLSTITKSFIKE